MMSLKIIVVPCLADNYAYIIHDKLANKTTLVDAPDFYPIQQELEKKKWVLDNILITHHHEDHIAGVAELSKLYNPKVFGAESDKSRLPHLDVSLSDRDKFSIGNHIFKCIDVPGHTLGHVAFYCASENIVFTGDSLMTLGCGRIFEGTAQQMFESLGQLKKLPEITKVFSGHEYARQNAKFSLTVEPDNSFLIEQAKQIEINLGLKLPNVGFSLLTEKKTNPFLRADTNEIKVALGLEDRSDLDTFTTLRKMKDEF